MNGRRMAWGMVVIGLVMASGWGLDKRVLAADEAAQKQQAGQTAGKAEQTEEQVVLLARADFALEHGDTQRGIDLLRQAADKGSAEALYRLAIRHAAGKGVPEDPEQARRLMKKAADLGHAEAMREMAEYLMKGYGGPKDAEAGFALMRKAAEAGDGRALFRMALFALGNHYKQADASQGIAWLKQAAEKGYKRAYYFLAAAYLSGEGVEKNLSKAYEWAWKGAEAGELESAYLLGMSLAAGENVPEDVVEGLKWLQISLALMGESDERYQKTLSMMRDAYHNLLTKDQQAEFERRYVAWVTAHWGK